MLHLIFIITTLSVFGVIIFLFVSFYIGIFGAAPYVPTSMRAVKNILKHAKIKKGDKIYDLGAGDGRFVHLSSKLYGAKATGFELNFFIYLYAKVKQLLFRWKGQMIWGNFLKHDISDADIIFCYLMPSSLKKYQQNIIKNLKKGTKILSYQFSIGDLEPIKIIPKEGRVNKIVIYQV